MYLLKLLFVAISFLKHFHLHSTMYLLKPCGFFLLPVPRTVFTFHYVSIKTVQASGYILILINLHSTMYLLKHILEDNTDLTVLTFTFHYVSIKTNYEHPYQTDKQYLHSTMYLLKLLLPALLLLQLLIYIPLCIY